jgi:hypothetical protein
VDQEIDALRAVGQIRAGQGLPLRRQALARTDPVH